MGLASQRGICNTVKVSSPRFVLRVARCQPVPRHVSELRITNEAVWVLEFGDAETPTPDRERMADVRRAAGVVRRMGFRREGVRNT